MNLASWIVLAIVIGLVLLAIRSVIRGKPCSCEKGCSERGAPDCNCSSCAWCSTCPLAPKIEIEEVEETVASE